MPKADNMLAVLWLLRSRRRVTAPEIAAALEISVRTAYRYIDALCASGVPVIADVGPDGGYSLPETFRGVPLVLEPQELKALFQAALFARYAGYPYAAAMEAALGKLTRTLSPEQSAALQRRVETLRAVPRGRSGSLAAGWLEPLEQAVADSATVRIHYQKPSAPAPVERNLDPYGLVFHGSLWYVVGFCHLRQSIRPFRVDRIHDLERTGERFVRPADFQPEVVFDQEQASRQAETGPFTVVRLSGTPAALTQLAEHWYLSQCQPERSGTELTLRLDPKGLEQIPSYLLPLQTDVVVLAPDELRRRLAATALSMALHHRKDRP